jgi:RNA polymerase sigma factor (sigma-70 family)
MSAHGTTGSRRETPDYGEWLAANYSSVERVCDWVSRRKRLCAADAAELRSIVLLKLVEDDYAILRKFAGRSRLSTYLTTVVNRIWSGWQATRGGRWRPSAEAKRLGATAERLEALTVRDGFTFDEAALMLRMNYRSPESAAELEGIYTALPRRARRRIVGEEFLNTVSADPASVDADDTDAVIERLEQLVEQLNPIDRRILQLKFAAGWSASRIADALQMNPQQVYRRMRRVLAELKQSLQPCPVRPALASAVLAAG